MNIKKIKYHIAVAAALAVTAFCGCGDKDAEMIRLDTPNPAREREAAEVFENDSGNNSQKTQEQLIKIYVCGAVRHPDVYTLDAGVRVIDAVNAAGGFAADAGSGYLNLASPLSDGQKVYIPTNAEIEDAMASGEEIYSAEVNITLNAPGIMSGTSEDNANDTNGQVDINSADKETLMTLPGIGASKADKIIAYREANGRFSSIEDIMLVGGIKEGLFNKVRDRICVR